MAIDARHGARFVRAASPEQLIAFGVTRQARRILLFHRRRRILGEADEDRFLAPARIYVSFAGAMTGFTAARICRSFGMRHGSAHHRVHKTFLLRFVAGHAYIRANVVTVGLRGGWGATGGFWACRFLIACQALGPRNVPP
jgi:hypothetical protein